MLTPDVWDSIKYKYYLDYQNISSRDAKRSVEYKYCPYVRESHVRLF